MRAPQLNTINKFTTAVLFACLLPILHADDLPKISDNLTQRAEEIARFAVSGDYVVGLYAPIVFGDPVSDSDDYLKWRSSPSNYMKSTNQFASYQLLKLVSPLGVHCPPFINLITLNGGIGVRYTFIGGECPLYLVVAEQDKRHPGGDLYRMPQREDSIYGLDAPPLKKYPLPIQLKHNYKAEVFEPFVSAIKAAIVSITAAKSQASDKPPGNP